MHNWNTWCVSQKCQPTNHRNVITWNKKLNLSLISQLPLLDSNEIEWRANTEIFIKATWFLDVFLRKWPRISMRIIGVNNNNENNNKKNPLELQNLKLSQILFYRDSQNELKHFSQILWAAIHTHFIALDS